MSVGAELSASCKYSKCERCSMSLCTEKKYSEHHLGQGRLALKTGSKGAVHKAGASPPISGSSEKPVRDCPASEANYRLFCFAKDRYPAFRVDMTELFSRWLVGAG